MSKAMVKRKPLDIPRADLQHPSVTLGMMVDREAAVKEAVDVVTEHAIRRFLGCLSSLHGGQERIEAAVQAARQA